MSGQLPRRDLLAAAGSIGLVVGLGALAAGCTTSPSPHPAPVPIPSPRPGPGEVVRKLPGTGRDIAWTVDDGADRATLDAYVDMMVRTGVPVTFCPTHLFAASWEACSDRLKPLLLTGQAQIVNHTWSHRVLSSMSDTAVVREISDNEDWIESVFGITSRPYLRPPMGLADSRVRALAGSLGFTRILMWTTSLGDSSKVSGTALMSSARQSLYPDAILLGHANYGEVVSHFDEINGLIAARRLHPVTIDQAMGTSRAVG